MSLFGDVNEVKKLWSKATAGEKVFLVFSTFLSATSIASVSESVVKWKGFIKESLNFYLEFFVWPIKKAFYFIGINVPIHYILIVITHIIMLRALISIKDFYDHEATYKWFQKLGNRSGKLFNLTTLFVELVFIVLSVLVMKTLFWFTKYYEYGLSAYNVFVVYYSSAFILFGLLLNFRSKNFLYFSIYCTAPIVVVGVFAGINKGLLS